MVVRAILVGFGLALLGCGGLLGPRTAEHGTCGSSLPPPAVPGVPVVVEAKSPGLHIDGGLHCFDLPSGITCSGLHGQEILDWKVSRPRDIDSFYALDAESSLKVVGSWQTGRPAPSGTFTSLYAEGAGGGCVLDAAGQATCFGFAPEEVPEGPLVDVVATIGAACGLRPDGTITCTGYDDGCFDDPPPGSWTSITAGFGVACAIDGGGNVACWGRTEDQAWPTRAKVIAIDRTRWCAITPDDTLECGGRFAIDPVPEGRFRHVDLDDDLACAIRETGEPLCFGLDGDDTLPWQREVPPGWVTVEGGTWRAALPSAPEITSGQAGRWLISTWVAYGPSGEEYAVNEVRPGPEVVWSTPEELLALVRPTHETTLGSMFAGGTWVTSEIARDVPARRYGVSFQRRDMAWRKSIQHMYALADRVVVVSFTGKPELDAIPHLRAFEVGAP